MRFCGVIWSRLNALYGARCFLTVPLLVCLSASTRCLNAPFGARRFLIDEVLNHAAYRIGS